MNGDNEWLIGKYIYLINELLKVRGGGVDAFQVVVEGELGQGLPGRGEGVDLDRVHAQRRLVPDCARRDQRDPLHRTEPQFASVLQFSWKQN